MRLETSKAHTYGRFKRELMYRVAVYFNGARVESAVVADTKRGEIEFLAMDRQGYIITPDTSEDWPAEYLTDDFITMPRTGVVHIIDRETGRSWGDRGLKW